MPTKMNRSEQQPYVPKGDDNGGEYRSYGYGGNPIPKGAYKKIKPKKGIKVEPSKKKDGSFIDYIEKNHKDSEFGKRLKSDFEAGQKEGKDLLNKAMKEHGFGYKQSKGGQDYFSAFEDVVLSAQSSTSEDYSKGGVFYHESYHALDFIYGRVSTTFVTSNGKTLEDTLIGKQKPPMRKRLEEARKDFKKFEQEFYEKNYPNLNENKKELESIRKEAENTKEYQEISEKMEAFNRLPFEERYKRNSELLEYFRKLNDIVEEYKRDKKKELRDKISSSRYEFEKAKNAIWGDVSDMFCMQGFGYVFGMGHSSSYAKDTSRRCREFFAECGSAENTNPKSLELIKKYFPEQYQAYRECIEHIKGKK